MAPPLAGGWNGERLRPTADRPLARVDQFQPPNFAPINHWRRRLSDFYGTNGLLTDIGFVQPAHKELGPHRSLTSLLVPTTSVSPQKHILRSCKSTGCLSNSCQNGHRPRRNRGRGPRSALPTRQFHSTSSGAETAHLPEKS